MTGRYPRRSQGGRRLHEADLVARGRAGDRAALEALFEAHGRELYRLAYAVLGDRDEAEDALQEVIVKAIRGLGRFDARRPLAPWLRRITVNECLTRLRARRRVRPLVVDDLPTDCAADPGADPAVEVGNGAVAAEVRKALAALPPGQRVAMGLVALDGLSLRAVAEAMGCSVGTVKSHLHRAREKLRLQLRDLLPPGK